MRVGLRGIDDVVEISEDVFNVAGAVVVFLTGKRSEESALAGDGDRTVSGLSRWI